VILLGLAAHGKLGGKADYFPAFTF
jgi:hypothetical protein